MGRIRSSKIKKAVIGGLPTEMLKETNTLFTPQVTSIITNRKPKNSLDKQESLALDRKPLARTHSLYYSKIWKRCMSDSKRLLKNGMSFSGSIGARIKATSTRTRPLIMTIVKKWIAKANEKINHLKHGFNNNKIWTRPFNSSVGCVFSHGRWSASFSSKCVASSIAAQTKKMPCMRPTSVKQRWPDCMVTQSSNSSSTKVKIQIAPSPVININLRTAHIRIREVMVAASE